MIATSFVMHKTILVENCTILHKMVSCIFGVVGIMAEFVITEEKFNSD